jgi:hypothetical protein
MHADVDVVHVGILRIGESTSWVMQSWCVSVDDVCGVVMLCFYQGSKVLRATEVLLESSIMSKR